MRLLFIFPNIDVGGYKPLGVSILSAIARRHGCEVELFDTSFFDVSGLSSNLSYLGMKESGEEALGVIPCDTSAYNLTEVSADIDELFMARVREFAPDLIAVSIFSQEYHLGMHLLGLAKQVNPAVRTIAGGVHCIADPEGVARRPEVDLICIGEGERTIETILLQMKEGRWEPALVPAAAYRDGDVIRKTATGPYIELDALPYQDNTIYDDRLFLRVYNGKVYRSLDVCLTRGCFERCVYCLFDKIYDDYGSSSVRRYGATRFVEELEFLVAQHNIEFIRFQDSTFCNVSTKYLEELSKLYIERIGLPFVIDTTPQQVNDSKVALLKAMGCQSMSIGIETGNQDMRNTFLNKKATNDHIRKAFACANDAGIRTVSFILLGFPFETRDYIFQTIRLIRECRVSSPNVGFVYPFKGSALRKTVIEKGLFDPATEIHDTPQYTQGRPVIANPNITAEEYQGIYRAFPFYCKFPEDYWPYIQVAEKTDPEGQAMYRRCREFYDRHNLYNRYMMVPNGDFMANR